MSLILIQLCEYEITDNNLWDYYRDPFECIANRETNAVASHKLSVI